MSRQSSIRWRESDLNELRRLVKKAQYNTRRDQRKLIEQDRRYEASQLPRYSMKELRNAIETRKDYNETIKTLKNYIETGNKYTIDRNTKRSLTATVRDFNLKVDRLTAKAKTQGERAALPDKITEEELIKLSSSRGNLIDLVKTYKGFLRRGAETIVELPDTKHNIKRTKWEIDTMEAWIEPINENRDRERFQWQEAEVKYGGKSAGYKQGQARMDDGDFDQFDHIKLYNYSSTYRDMREKFNLMIRERQEGYWDARTELARINYTELMSQVLGNDPIGKILLKQIKSMDLKDFKRVLMSEDDMWLLLYDIRTQPDRYDQLLEEVYHEWNPDKDMYTELDKYISRKVGE